MRERPAWRGRLGAGTIGAALVLLLILGAAFAPLLTPYDPVALRVGERLQPPSLAHPFGTDHQGRDVFARVLHGGRVALGVAVSAVVLGLGSGVLLGLVAALGPRWLDAGLVLAFDSMRAFPTVLLGLTLLALWGPGTATLVALFAVATAPAYARLVRTRALSLMQSPFIEQERAMGAGFWRILVFHLLPNATGPVLVLASMDIPSLIAMEAGLSFLGLGVQPPTPSWGAVLKAGYDFSNFTPWPVIAGSLPLIMATLGFTLIGEALRDRLDPRTVPPTR